MSPFRRMADLALAFWQLIARARFFFLRRAFGRLGLGGDSLLWVGGNMCVACRVQRAEILFNE